MDSLLGPAYRDAWFAYVAKAGAEYHKAGLWEGERVVTRVGDWAIVMDMSMPRVAATPRIHTRLRAVFGRESDFRFELDPAGGFVAKRSTLPVVDLGYAEFAGCCTVRASDGERARRVFQDSDLRRRIVDESGLSIAIRHSARDSWLFAREQIPEGAADLCLRVPDAVASVERIERLHDVCRRLLDQLGKAGVARPMPLGR